MILSRAIPAALFTLLLAGAAAAQDSGTFLIRLGQDTTAVERFTFTPSRVTSDQASRAPRAFLRHYEFALDAKGLVSHTTYLVSRPGAPAGTPAVQDIDAGVVGDSLVVRLKRDTTVTRLTLGVTPGTLVFALGGWALYDELSMRLAAGKSDSLSMPLAYIGARSLSHLKLTKTGQGKIDIETQTDLYHVDVDAKGRIQHVTPVHGTQQFTVDRIADTDPTVVAASFAAREQGAGPMGALSTRDTVRTSSAGATLWIDYGRPAKRGRTVYGGVVPWDAVWRTGANAATQFRTDKDLVFGGVTVPAGFYTLWTIPSAKGWKLVVNSETGQWGTDHKSEKDLYTIPMSTSSLADPVERFTITVTPGAQGGTLNLDWDTTRAIAAFTVKP